MKELVQADILNFSGRISGDTQNMTFRVPQLEELQLRLLDVLLQFQVAPGLQCKCVLIFLASFLRYSNILRLPLLGAGGIDIPVILDFEMSTMIGNGLSTVRKESG